MAIWKVIALVSDNIEAVSGPDAQRQPETHGCKVWEGQATDKAEAFGGLTWHSSSIRIAFDRRRKGTPTH
jgi:hypothetical protein